MSSIKSCPTCETRFIDGQHFWATGRPGNPMDLAGLVCNQVKNSRPCINPCRGLKGGDTWANRAKQVELALDGLDEPTSKKTQLE